MKIATANRLTDGAVVYLGARHWVEDIGKAFVGRSDSEIMGLEAQMLQSEATQEVVGAYLIDAEKDQGRIRAVRFRERIRADGPTVRTGLGRGHVIRRSAHVPL